MFETIGLLLRFPFFILGVLLWSVVVIPLWLIGFFVQSLRLPFAFMGAAWRNDKQEWENKLKDFGELFKSEVFVWAYRSCYNWLIGKSKN